MFFHFVIGSRLLYVNLTSIIKTASKDHMQLRQEVCPNNMFYNTQEIIRTLSLGYANTIRNILS
jgi:hypothetical protein